MRSALHAAVVLVAGAISSVHAAEVPLYLVVANRDGTHARVTWPLTETQRAAASHFWAWTDGTPPRKFDLRKGSPGGQDLFDALEQSSVRPVEVRLRGWSRKEELATVRVIAAPVEMWGSVPESLLPSFSVSETGTVAIPASGALRIRALGERVGSMWEQMRGDASRCDITLRRPASDAEMRFRTADGGLPGRLYALVMSRRRGEAAAALQAQFAADPKGALRIPALPQSEIVALFVTSEHAAPQTISGTAEELSRTILLPPAAEVRGRFIDEEGRPVSGVKVVAEGWVSPDAPAASRGEVTSDSDGRWAIRGLPRVRLAVRAMSDSHATFRTTLQPESDELDIGTVTLAHAAQLTLIVTDSTDVPLAGVRVRSDGGFEGRTDDEGMIRVSRLSPTEQSVLTATAAGFRKQTHEVVPPLPKETKIVLERAFTVKGTLSTESGAALDGAAVTIKNESNYRREEIGTDGTFSLDVLPDAEFSLTFESPATASLTRAEPAGEAGEVRDLGLLRLLDGHGVRGRVTDSAGVPVPGARVWTIRPGEGGAVAAWVAGRLVQTTTGADGAFDLRGLSEGPALLRIDAPDFARAYRDIVMETAPLDVGSLTLLRGSVVTVNVPRSDAVIARLDLRGDALDADMLTAPVVEREARLRQVPPGRYGVTVLNAGGVVCDRTVDVAEGMDVSVDCPSSTLVRGRVLLGGAVAPGGTLIWSRPGKTDALISNRHSPLGALQQQIYGAGGGRAVVAVGPDGTFETDQLHSGEWQVAWRPADSIGTPERAFVVPEAAEAVILVVFEGNVLRGRVTDAEGRPLARAAVREIQGPSHALTAADGTFAMMAVAPGVHRLHATLAGKSSRVIEVTVEPNREVPPVTLEIGDDDANTVAIRVVNDDGLPIASAFVFLESIAGTVRILMTNAAGEATTSVPEGIGDLVRVAAYGKNVWGFGKLKKSADGVPGPHATTVRFVRTGSLRIRSRTASGPAVIQSPDAPADLAWMLTRIGSFPTVKPDVPLLIQGLPPGNYRIQVDTSSALVAITAGATAAVDLP